MSDRRGRQRSDYDNRDYSDDRQYYDDGGHYDNQNSYDDYDREPRSHHRPRPQPTRQRSLGRQALDKLQSAIGGFVSDNNKPNTRRPRSRSRSRSRSTSRSRSSSRTRHHSRSPPRRRSTHAGHSERDRDRDRGGADRYYPPSSSRRHQHHSPEPRHRSRGRRDSTTSGTSHPPSASERSRSRWERGIKAAMEAGATEAFRLRKEPGPWTGAKGGRIATAALSAGVIRGVAADHGNHGHGGDGGGSGGGKLGSLASAAGGMMVNRLVNRPRKEVGR